MALRAPLLIIFSALLLISVAQARHTKKTRATDYTAYTLNDGEARVGLFRLGYGITDTLEIGTMQWLWIVRIKNLNAKWSFWKNKRFTTSVSAGYFWGNPRDLGEQLADIPFSAFPLYGTVTWRKRKWTLSTSLGYTFLDSEYKSAAAEGGNEIDLEAALQGSTSVLLPSVEWRWSKTTALVLEARFLLKQEVGGGFKTNLDENTEAELHANAGMDGSGLSSYTLGAFWSWKNFNLRLGWNFGHVMIPTVNVFIPEKFAYPDLDLFWRF